jgi:RNA polymerase sigma factor (TIGR02999 family)
MSEATEILAAVQKGDKHAAAQLLPLVYGELRKLATARLANESAPPTLNATALVHEAYLRLVGERDCEKWDSQAHFFAAAAEAMRRILVDAARRRQSQKRGGGASIGSLHDLDLPLAQPPAEILAISEALDGLQLADAKAAELVKLRYFAGFTIPEAAAILGMAPRSADNLWSYARAWLGVALKQGGP